MSLEDRLNWITAIVTAVTHFADEVDTAVLSVSIDCGKYEFITIKEKEDGEEGRIVKSRRHVIFYDDHVFFSKRYTYEQKDTVIEELLNFFKLSNSQTETQ